MTAPTITPRAAALIEDTEWLVRMGTPHWMIPPRVGYADGQGLRAKLRRLYTVDEAADELRISRTSIHQLIRDSRLLAKKFGTRTLIPGESLDDFIGDLPDA